MESQALRTTTTAPAVPVGGFVLLTVPQLLMPWWLYLEKRLQLVDVRVFLALFELRKERSFMKAGRTPRYKLEELLRLVGGSRSRIRAAVRRLEAVGLVSFKASCLHMATSPEVLRVADLVGFWAMHGNVRNNRRQVPLPRRLLKFVAGGTTRVETATIIAHALRCLYFRDGKVAPVGNCTAAWAAEVFGVNESNVKAARQRLVGLGVFLEHEMPQWHRNRYGARIEVNLRWGRGSAEVEAPAKRPESRPPVAVIHTPNATPKENQNLPTEGKHQNPGALPPTPKPGVLQTKAGKESGKQAAPSLRHLVIEDLRDPQRLIALHEAAAAMQLVPDGERGQLEFFALAEHARSYATRNAPGLMAQLIRNYSTWGRRFINQDDEEAARARLRQFTRPEPQDAVPEKHAAVRLTLPEKGGPQPVGALLDELLADVRCGAASTRRGNGGSVPEARCSLNVRV